MVKDLQKTVGNRATSQLVGSQKTTGSQLDPNKTVQKGKSKIADLGSNGKVIAALEVFATKADPGTVAAGANMFAMVSKKVDDKDLGKGVTGSGSATGSVQAGAWASASAQQLANAYVVLVEAKVIAGGSLQLEGELKRKFGNVEGAIRGNLHMFAGAVAQAKGHAKVEKNDKGNITGLDVGGEASAFAGAKAEQNVEAEFGTDTLSATLNANSKQMMGASAAASGTFALAKNNIAINGEVSAFAGMKAEGSVGGGLKLFGRDALKGSATGKASLGVGTEGHGRFELRRGVLTLALHGHAALGVGGGAGADAAVDFKPIAVWIYRQIDKQYWKANPTKASKVLNSPDSVKPQLAMKLAEYAKAKEEAIRADKADNYVKIEKVQQIVGNLLPRKQVKGHPNAAKIDAMIKEAIESSFLAAPGEKVEATVTDGKIEEIKGLRSPSEIGATSRARSMELAKKGTTLALDDIAPSSNIRV
ncbi:hypothetical protein [Ferrimicrobium sp.]|uniref:hypothetical protein n=1 Tax=Ferrimicrobium sp. TaxID=2926050 RepID=UPI0026105191|nr:hypothetical protein [Ferrimicrobium sp.]